MGQAIVLFVETEFQVDHYLFNIQLNKILIRSAIYISHGCDHFFLLILIVLSLVLGLNNTSVVSSCPLSHHQ